MSSLLGHLGMGAASLAGGAAVHGLGLGQLLEPLDYPRQALWNSIYKPYKALESGDWSELLGALPGVAGAVGGGLIGGPAGILAGSLIGGALQGVGKATGSEHFEAPQVSDLTGTEDFLPNLAVGALTDPLTYAGLGGTGGAQAAKWGAADAAGLRKMLGGAEPFAESAMNMAGKAAGGGFEAPRGQAGPFYSRLEEAIGKMPDSMKKESVLNFLKKQGAPGEEIEATGLLKALAETPGDRIDRGELLGWHDQNRLQVNDVFKGANFSTPEQAAEFEALKFKRLTGTRLSAEERARYQMLQGLEGDPTRYHDYQTQVPGNYKEMLLTMPERSLPPAEAGELAQLKAEAGGRYPGDANFDRIQALKNKQMVERNFYGGHWEEPNVLAHVRFKEGAGPRGERLLHLEELQSDWHQQGREKGYIPSEPTPDMLKRDALRQQIDEMTRQLDSIAVPGVHSLSPDQADAFRALQHERANLMEQANAINIGAVPDAPFKDAWGELALKRMLHYAAKNDFERITWSPAEMIQQALGNDLTDHNFPGQVGFYGSQLPESELAAALKGAVENTGYGSLTKAQEAVHAGTLPPEQYAANLQKNARLPNMMQKYAKKFGAELEPITLPGTGGEMTLAEIIDQRARYARDLAHATHPMDIAALEENLTNYDRYIEEARQGRPPRGAPQVMSMPVTEQLKREALTRGFPLLSLAPLLAAGGASPLLMALAGREQNP